MQARDFPRHLVPNSLDACKLVSSIDLGPQCLFRRSVTDRVSCVSETPISSRHRESRSTSPVACAQVSHMNCPSQHPPRKSATPRVPTNGLVRADTTTLHKHVQTQRQYPTDTHISRRHGKHRHTCTHAAPMHPCTVSSHLCIYISADLYQGIVTSVHLYLCFSRLGIYAPLHLCLTAHPRSHHKRANKATFS